MAYVYPCSQKHTCLRSSGGMLALHLKWIFWFKLFTKTLPLWGSLNSAAHLYSGWDIAREAESRELNRYESEYNVKVLWTTQAYLLTPLRYYYSTHWCNNWREEKAKEGSRHHVTINHTHRRTSELSNVFIAIFLRDADDWAYIYHNNPANVTNSMELEYVKDIKNKS